MALGLVVVSIIWVPVVMLVLAALLGPPRRLRVTGLLLGMMAAVLLAFLVVAYILGLFLSLVVP